jgi:methylase of polypeptide subunit release factors
MTEFTGRLGAGPPPRASPSPRRRKTAGSSPPSRPAKPGGAILELGTGTGLGTAFLLAGMNAAVTPVTVELSQPLSDIAREEIADPRVEWVIADGGDWLTAAVTREDR